MKNLQLVDHPNSWWDNIDSWLGAGTLAGTNRGDQQAIDNDRNPVYLQVPDSESAKRIEELASQIVDGIDGKYANKVLFPKDNTTYYADPNAYTKEYFQKKQHLVRLKMLAKATGVDLSKVDGHTNEALEGKEIYGDIRIYQNEYTNELDNDVVNLRAIPVEETV